MLNKQNETNVTKPLTVLFVIHFFPTLLLLSINTEEFVDKESPTLSTVAPGTEVAVLDDMLVNKYNIDLSKTDGFCFVLFLLQCLDET